MKKLLRLVPSVSLLLLAAQLVGCDPATDAACTTNAECATGLTCTAGSCLASQAQAGAGGSLGVPSGSAGSGGAVTPGASGSATNGGNVAVAGTTGVGGFVGSGGTSQANGGTSSNGGSQTTGGTNANAGTTGNGGTSFGPNGATPGQCKDDFWPAANNGSVTRYDFKQGTSLPACAYAITHTGNGSDGDWDTVEGISTGDGGYFGAMNTTDYAQGAACGACVEASYNGRKVVLTIVDECPIGTNPLCTKGHIDLSRKAIRQLEPNSSLENIKNVSWKYVKCPASGNVKVRLHPNQNADWQPVVVENGLYPLKSVTLNGVNATRTGNNAGGNAWIAAKQKAPYSVFATDVNDNAVRFDYSGGPGLKDAGFQFMCQ